MLSSTIRVVWILHVISSSMTPQSSTYVSFTQILAVSDDPELLDADERLAALLSLSVLLLLLIGLLFVPVLEVLLEACMQRKRRRLIHRLSGCGFICNTYQVILAIAIKDVMNPGPGERADLPGKENRH